MYLTAFYAPLIPMGILFACIGFIGLYLLFLKIYKNINLIKVLDWKMEIIKLKWGKI